MTQILNQNGLRIDQELMATSHSNLRDAYQSSECKPVDPRVVFFIRIAKCASTSFVHLLRTLSKSSSFDLFFHPSGAYDWDVRTMKQVADLAKTKRRKFVYARHFYYVDFHPYDLKDYTYITFIRDPVTRFISSYLYYHFSSKAHIQAIVDPTHKNESLMSCLEHQHEGCTPNLMTKYFCGHHRFCKLGNEEALRTAKENLKKDFVAVGLIEEMDTSLNVFVKTLPILFTKEGLKEPILPNVVNKNENSMEFSVEEKRAVQNANLADIELYRYARELLHKKALACGL